MGRGMWAALAVVVGCAAVCRADDAAASWLGILDRHAMTTDVDAALHGAGVSRQSGTLMLYSVMANGKPLAADCIASWGPYEATDPGDYTRAVASLQRHNWRTVKHRTTKDMRSVSLQKGGWTTTVSDNTTLGLEAGPQLVLLTTRDHC